MPPQRYDHCTIFNSDIVGFTKISKVCLVIIPPVVQIRYQEIWYD